METRAPYDFFQLRIPTFPVENILQLNQLLDSPQNPGNDILIKKMFSHPWFMEAIYLASKDLFEILSGWLEGTLTDTRKVDKLIRSLHKYYARMCTRSTPYGLFAGCTTGVIMPGPTDIRFAAHRTKRYSRLDMSYIMELLDELERDPAFRSQLNYFPNTSIYKIRDKYRYFERKGEKHRRPYSLTSVNVSEYTSLLLRLSGSGMTIRQMTDAILQHSDGQLAEDRILSFVNGLIDMQFLISELAPAVTGEDFAGRLLRKLCPLRGTERICHSLQLIISLLQQDEPFPDAYHTVDKTAGELAGRDAREVIQTDLCFNMASARIDETIITDIRNTAARLQQISRQFKMDALTDFKKNFSDRYEQREIPLIQALDTDTGIGYSLAVNGNVELIPLLGKLSTPQFAKKPEFVYDRFTQMICEKVKQHLTSGAIEVPITDQEIDALLKDQPEAIPEAPNSFILGNLLAASQDDLDQGNYRFFARHLNAPYASKILARFSCSDPQLQSCLAAIMKKEEDEHPDVIFAEIVHIPEDIRLTNIIMRPSARSHEIPYLCQSSLDTDGIIPVDDLMIKIRNGRIVLTSARLKKEVQPRLTNSHNYVGGLPLYKFLCDLQFDGIKQGFRWEWKFFASEPFLPRITYRNFIISRARWQIKQLPAAGSHRESYIDELRSTYKIPRYVVIADDDNELQIDLESPFCRKHLLAELKKRNVTLIEYLTLPDRCMLKDNAGSYAAEIVIPSETVMMGEKGQTPAGSARSYEPVTDPIAKRVFLPGSEWLYIKVYASNNTLENILGEVLYPFTERLLEKGTIEKWFFIRYNDPDSHLRIRFFKRSSDKSWIAAILDDLHHLLGPWLNEGLVFRVTLDTYTRELERYGNATMELSEDLFFADSRAIAAFASMIEGARGEDLRWKIAFHNVHSILDDFGMDMQQRAEFTDNMYKLYYQEFNKVPGESQNKLSRSLNDKYRSASPVFAATLDTTPQDDELETVIDLFKRRSIVNREIVSRIETAIASRPGSIKEPSEILPGIVHMSINRLFLIRQRLHELVLYHHLTKYYSSLNIRARQMAARETMNSLVAGNS